MNFDVSLKHTAAAAGASANVGAFAAKQGAAKADTSASLIQQSLGKQPTLGQPALGQDSFQSLRQSASFSVDSFSASGQYSSAGGTVAYQKQSLSVTVSMESEGFVYDAKGTSLVDRMKAEVNSIQARFLSGVKEMLTRQGKAINGDSDIWKTLASGDFTVDAKTKAEAQDAISEDGYWGVKKTSERLVKFARALVGNDPSRVEEMRDAFVKGFKQAEEAWGGKLPDITQQTYDATMKLFDDWADEGKASDSIG